MKTITQRLTLLFALFLTQNTLADTTQLTPKCNEPTAEGDRACWMKASNHGDCYVWNWSPGINETVTWSGQCRAGVAAGKGTETWEYDGGKLTLTGTIVNGQAHGRWEMRHEDGRIDDVVYDKGKETSRAPRFNPKFAIDGDVLRYNTSLAATEEWQEIIPEDLDFFEKVLGENPDIKAVYLTSWGGDVETSYEIADLIIDYELDTHAVDICFSGCATLLLGGKERTLERGSKIGFHRSWWDVDALEYYYEENRESEGWDSVFDFAAWVHEDAQEEIYRDFEFLLERGGDPLFSIKTLKADSDDGWYPRRKELVDANFLTK